MEQNGTDSPEPAPAALTDNQLAALPYLVASPTLAEGARLADIGRTTLYRWMNDPEFRATLERLRAEAADLAHTELRGLMLKGALVLAEAMEHPSPHGQGAGGPGRAVHGAQGRRPQGAAAAHRSPGRRIQPVGQEERGSVMHGLRGLERRLVQERTEIGVREAVDHLLRSWDHALTRGSSPPDPLVFFKTLAEAGFYLPTSQRALQYLAQCRLAASLPVRDRLLRILLPPGALRGPS